MTAEERYVWWALRNYLVYRGVPRGFYRIVELDTLWKQVGKVCRFEPRVMLDMVQAVLDGEPKDD